MASGTSSNDILSASTSSTMPTHDASFTREDKGKDVTPQDAGAKNRSTQMNACATCRKRKIKCDGITPSCGRCTRLKVDCAYEENRRKSGPRRGYVKGLQTRLAQVEALLKEQDSTGSGTPSGSNVVLTTEPYDNASDQFFEDLGMGVPFVQEELVFSSMETGTQFTKTTAHVGVFPPSTQDAQTSAFLTEEFSRAMIELGVQEPLPPQETIDELTQVYFTKIHQSTPVIHQYRFLAAMNLAPNSRPSISLRYAMWALAASIIDKYKGLHSHFHARARKYAEADETAGRQKYINIRHAQAWILIGIYEFKMMMFPNAWLTTGRATRLTQMLGFNRLDGLGLDVKQSLPDPIDISEKEERRRTFWMAFCMDRYAGVGTGWPLIVDERDILTHLPSSEEAYEQNISGPGIFLNDAMNPVNAPLLSAFAGVVVVASLTGRILHHLQRPDPEDNDEDLNSTFWRNHRKIDSTLLNMSLYLPPHLRLPVGSSNANTIFLNMSLQSAVICLHQAAIFKGEKVANPEAVVGESKARCLAAGMEIASIMKRIAHMDLSLLNVYTPFGLYLAMRIFAQVSKSHPDNEDAISTMRFLLSALMALKEANPLVDSYLIQLDLEGIGLSALQENIRDFSQLEKGVAGMSMQEPTDESEWITFVSPLVRIVEETEKSTSSPSNSHQMREGSASTSNPSDDPKGKRTMSSETLSIETPGGIPGLDSPGFGIHETWYNDPGDMQGDIFDSLMDFGGSK